MAAKKYYAVKRGKAPGIFEDWASCKASVDGFPKAEYKGFATLEEARTYLGMYGEGPEAGKQGMYGEGAEVGKQGMYGEGTEAGKQGMYDESAEAGKQDESRSIFDAAYKTVEGRLLAYVDGSYHDGMKKYAFGCVFLLPGHDIRIAYGNGDNPQSLQQRNVVGEMLGAMYAVKTAMQNGYKEVELCYDYEGIEKWVTGSWRSKTELTQKYAQAMREWGKSIHIFFTKVEAHSNVVYNELADQTAKWGLTAGDGIPKIRRLEELERYEGE